MATRIPLHALIPPFLFLLSGCGYTQLQRPVPVSGDSDMYQTELIEEDAGEQQPISRINLQEQADSLVLEELRADIIDMVGVPFCLTRADCRLAKLGISKCEPDFLVYSVLAVNPEGLDAHIRNYQSRARYLYNKWGWDPPFCHRAPSAPLAECRSGLCVKRWQAWLYMY